MLFSSHLFEIICSFIHPTTAVNKITYARAYNVTLIAAHPFYTLYAHVMEAVSKRGYFDRAQQRRRQYFEGQRVINMNKTDQKAYLQQLEQATFLF